MSDHSHVGDTPMVRGIRATIDAYLVGQLSLRDVEMWVVAHLQDILDAGDTRAIEAADEVDTAIVELGEGLIGIQELRQRLEAALRSTETGQTHLTNGYCCGGRLRRQRTRAAGRESPQSAVR